MNFENKLNAFKQSARVYKTEKKRLAALPKSALNADTQMLHDFLKADIDFVDGTLSKIEQTCGPNARLIIYLLFVEGETYKVVGDDFELSKRQLQRYLDKWLHLVFDEEI